MIFFVADRLTNEYIPPQVERSQQCHFCNNNSQFEPSALDQCAALCLNYGTQSNSFYRNMCTMFEIKVIRFADDTCMHVCM